MPHLTARVIPVVIAVALVATLFGPFAAASPAHAGQRAGVILWNTLDNAGAVRHSAVGPNGAVSIAASKPSFVPGRFGGAYQATYDQDDLVRFPFWALNRARGTIEFWGRLVGWPAAIEGGGGDQPAFVELRTADGGSPNYRFIVYLTDNDGAGGGGLSAFVGHNETASGEYSGWNYADVLGPDTGGWHHYALAWDSRGIAGIGNGRRHLALFVDGRLASSWIATENYDGAFPGFESGSTLNLVAVDRVEHGTVQIDNLITWNCAVTDFRSRNVQKPMPRMCA